MHDIRVFWFILAFWAFGVLLAILVERRKFVRMLHEEGFSCFLSIFGISASGCWIGLVVGALALIMSPAAFMLFGVPSHLHFGLGVGQLFGFAGLAAFIATGSGIARLGRGAEGRVRGSESSQDPPLQGPWKRA